MKYAVYAYEINGNDGSSEFLRFFLSYDEAFIYAELLHLMSREYVYVVESL